MKRIKIIGARPYEHIRTLCNELKEDTRPEAAVEAADYLADFLPDRCVLVPVPGHGGRAEHTKRLAETVKNISAQKFPDKKTVVADILSSNVHPSLCAVKRAGLNPDDIKIKMCITGKRERMLIREYARDGYVIVLIDNVIDTGQTVRAAMSPFPCDCDIVVMAVGDTGRANVPENAVIVIRNDWYWGRTSLVNLAGGFASVKISVEEDAPTVAYISDLVVHPSRQRNGLGNELLTHALFEALNMGALTATLDTYPDNWLPEWYFRHGFKCEGITNTGLVRMKCDLKNIFKDIYKP